MDKKEENYFPEIPNIKIIKKIKQTKSSHVWLGKDITTANTTTSNSYLIIKGVTRLSLANNSIDFECLKRERCFLEENSLQPPNSFPKFIRSHKDDDFLYMIISFIEGVDFSLLIFDNIFNFHTLSQKEDFTNKKQIFLHIMAQIIDLLSQLHRKGIIYRDLKMNNLIIDKQLKMHLVDFGMIKKLNHPRERTKTVCGTYHVMAPEMFGVKYGKLNDYDLKVDVYSLGVLAYELFYSRPPFDYLNEFDEVKVKNYSDKVCAGFEIIYEKNSKNLVEFEDFFVENLCEVVKSCMQIDPENRPGVEDLKIHPLFENKFEYYLDCGHINVFDNYVEKIVQYIDFNGEFVECYERLEKEGDVFSNFFN